MALDENTGRGQGLPKNNNNNNLIAILYYNKYTKKIYLETAEPKKKDVPNIKTARLQ